MNFPQFLVSELKTPQAKHSMFLATRWATGSAVNRPVKAPAQNHHKLPLMSINVKGLDKKELLTQIWHDEQQRSKPYVDSVSNLYKAWILDGQVVIFTDDVETNQAIFNIILQLRQKSH